MYTFIFSYYVVTFYFLTLFLPSSLPTSLLSLPSFSPSYLHAPSLPLSSSCHPPSLTTLHQFNACMYVYILDHTYSATPT